MEDGRSIAIHIQREPLSIAVIVCSEAAGCNKLGNISDIRSAMRVVHELANWWEAAGDLGTERVDDF